MPVSAASAPASTVAAESVATSTAQCDDRSGAGMTQGRKRNEGEQKNAREGISSMLWIRQRRRRHAWPCGRSPSPAILRPLLLPLAAAIVGRRRRPKTASRPLLHGTLHHPGSLDLAVVLNPLALLTLSSHLSRRSSPTLSFSWRALADTSLWTQTDHPSHGQTEATLLEETATVADAEQLVRWPSSSLYPKLPGRTDQKRGGTLLLVGRTLVMVQTSQPLYCLCRRDSLAWW